MTTMAQQEGDSLPAVRRHWGCYYAFKLRRVLLGAFMNDGKPLSLKLCELITGVSGRAQDYTEKAFLAYIRNQGNLDGTDLPSELARFAFAATQESFSPAPFEYRLKTLEYNTYLLPIVQRAVFIMRYVLLLPNLRSHA